MNNDHNNFSIYHTITNIDRFTWDDLNYDNKICLSYQYLSGLEQAPPVGMQFRYTVIYKNQIPAGIAVFQLLPLTSRNFFKETKKDDYLKSKKHGFHLLICGNSLISGAYAYTYSSLISRDEFFTLLKNVIKKVKQSFPLYYHILGTIIKDIKTGHQDNAEIQNQQFYSFSPLPNMVVNNLSANDTFEQYIRSMKSKYRSRMRSVLKKGSAVARRDLNPEEIQKYRDTIYRLYLQVHNRASFKIVTLSPLIFEKWKEMLNDDFTLTGYFVEGQMIAFTTRFFSQELMEGYTHGLDYNYNKTYELYQNILLDDIKTGFARKVKKISFGRTSLAMKSSVGAVPEPLTFFARIHLPLPVTLILPGLQKIKPKAEYCRNPFE